MLSWVEDRGTETQLMLWPWCPLQCWGPLETPTPLQQVPAMQASLGTLTMAESILWSLSLSPPL
jgi:hypothetical protein